MTCDEFNTWYDDLKVRVPSLWKWAEDLPDTAATLRAWFSEVFEPLVFEDCMEVTRLILTGDLAVPYGSELPALYAREARRMAWERKERCGQLFSGDAPVSGTWDLVTAGKMAAAYEKAREIVRENGVEAMKGSRRHEWEELVP